MEFKIGDRVVTFNTDYEEFSHLRDGGAGRVIDATDEDNPLYLVLMDDEPRYPFNDPTTGWAFFEEELNHEAV